MTPTSPEAAITRDAAAVAIARLLNAIAITVQTNGGHPDISVLAPQRAMAIHIVTTLTGTTTDTAATGLGPRIATTIAMTAGELDWLSTKCLAIHTTTT